MSEMEKLQRMRLRRMWAASGRFWMIVSLMTLFGFPSIDTASAQGEGLTIEEAVRLAQTRNERTKIADERRAAAAARMKKARAFFFPDLTASGGYARSGSDDGGNDGSRMNRDPDFLLGTVTLNFPSLMRALFLSTDRPNTRMGRPASAPRRINAWRLRRPTLF